MISLSPQEYASRVGIIKVTIEYYHNIMDISTDGYYYQASNKSMRSERIFLDKDDFERFLGLLHIANSDGRFILRDAGLEDIFGVSRTRPLVDIFAYSILPDGFSIVVGSRGEGKLHRFIHKLSTAYAMYYNRKYHRQGPLFRGVCRVEPIEGSKRLYELVKETHLKPYSTGMVSIVKTAREDVSAAVECASTYEYSSMRDYIGEDRPQKVILTPLGA